MSYIDSELSGSTLFRTSVIFVISLIILLVAWERAMDWVWLSVNTSNPALIPKLNSSLPHDKQQTCDSANGITYCEYNTSTALYHQQSLITVVGKGKDSGVLGTMEKLLSTFQNHLQGILLIYIDEDVVRDPGDVLNLFIDACVKYENNSYFIVTREKEDDVATKRLVLSCNAPIGNAIGIKLRYSAMQGFRLLDTVSGKGLLNISFLSALINSPEGELADSTPLSLPRILHGSPEVAEVCPSTVNCLPLEAHHTVSDAKLAAFLRPVVGKLERVDGPLDIDVGSHISRIVDQKLWSVEFSGMVVSLMLVVCMAVIFTMYQGFAMSAFLPIGAILVNLLLKTSFPVASTAALVISPMVYHGKLNYLRLAFKLGLLLLSFDVLKVNIYAGFLIIMVASPVVHSLSAFTLFICFLGKYRTLWGELIGGSEYSAIKRAIQWNILLDCGWYVSELYRSKIIRNKLSRLLLGYTGGTYLAET